MRFALKECGQNLYEVVDAQYPKDPFPVQETLKDAKRHATLANHLHGLDEDFLNGCLLWPFLLCADNELHIHTHNAASKTHHKLPTVTVVTFLDKKGRLQEHHLPKDYWLAFLQFADNLPN